MLGDWPQAAASTTDGATRLTDRARPGVRRTGAPPRTLSLLLVKWTYFYLYVILDIFSRYVVGWMVAERESAELAKRLIAETCRK